MLLRNAVDRGRGDEHHARHTRIARRAQNILGTTHVHRPDRVARSLDRQRGRSVNDDIGAGDERADLIRVANVAAELLDRLLELGIVERHNVQRPDLVPVGEQPPREVQAEEARAAGDGKEHYGRAVRAGGRAGASCVGGLGLTSTAAGSSTAIPTMLSPSRLPRRRPRTPPPSLVTAGTATSLCTPPQASASETRPIFTSSTWP